LRGIHPIIGAAHPVPHKNSPRMLTG